MRKINRSDVLMAYQEKYGGYGTNEDECGFDYFVDVSQMEGPEIGRTEKGRRNFRRPLA